MEIKLMKGKILFAFLQYYKPYKKQQLLLLPGHLPLHSWI